MLTAGPILGTLADMVADRRVDLAGVVDATQAARVLDQWAENPQSHWKIPSLRAILASGTSPGSARRPTDRTACATSCTPRSPSPTTRSSSGSFNLSHAGERNAENVLEVRDAALADRLAAFIDDVRARYPDRVPIEAAGARP